MKEYYQIEISDDSALSGPSLCRLIQTLARETLANHVVVGRAEGAAPDFATKWIRDEFLELSIEKFLLEAKDVMQFDWGNFFLTDGTGRLADLSPMSPYPSAIKRALALVRAVDDTYWYIYLATEGAMRALLQQYPSAVVKKGLLEALDYPE